MTQSDVLDILRAAIAAAGSQKAWAAFAGCSPQYTGDVLAGRRDPGETILAALGLRRIVTYERLQAEVQP